MGGGISKKPRSSNLELYRIISMLVIVAHHYVVNSGVTASMAECPLSANSIYLYLFGMWGKVGINCFLLITGYFMCTSNITFRKWLKLYLWIITYGVIINAIFLLTGRRELDWTLLYIFFPFRNVHTDSFTSTFMVWWLFIPLLNILVNNCTKKQHQYLLLMTLVVFSIYPFVPKLLNIDSNPICWFSTIYFVASYLRKYPEMIPHSNSAKFWGVMSIITIGLSMLSVVSILYLGDYLGMELPQYYMVIDSDKPLALLVAVSTFMFFKNLNIPYSKFINIAGGASFGVLLIHAGSNAMRQWLWKDTVDCIGSYDMPFWQLIIYSNLVVLAIYAICATIDYIRLKTIEEPIFRLIDKKI